MEANPIRTGTIAKYPGIKLIVAHGGGTIPYLHPRLLTALGVQGGKLFPSFYYDLTATAMPGQTELLRDVVDISNRLTHGCLKRTDDFTSVCNVASGST